MKIIPENLSSVDRGDERIRVLHIGDTIHQAIQQKNFSTTSTIICE